MNNLNHQIKKLPAYRAMGLKCDVSFTEMEVIKDTVQSSMSRVGELEYAINKDIRLGLSYHLRPDGFVYYSVYEVQEQQQLPEDMVEINIPEMTYLVTKHKDGSIEETYLKIMEWIRDNEYKVFKESGVDYYDELPIKYEKHINESPFEILIPIVKL